MIANRGVCVIASGGGSREMPVEAFCTGVGVNALAADEFLLGLKFPRPPAYTGDAYLRFIPRTEMDIAVAGCGVSLTLNAAGVCTAARVGIGAVAADTASGGRRRRGAARHQSGRCGLGRGGRGLHGGVFADIGQAGGTTVQYRRKVVAVLCRRAAAIARERTLSAA